MSCSSLGSRQDDPDQARGWRDPVVDAFHGYLTSFALMIRNRRDPCVIGA
jgi:hypothetical protein